MDLANMTDEEWEAEGAKRHAEMYPDGCRQPGHNCDACMKRLGETAHVIRSRRIGARKFYKGTVEYRCTECSYV